MFVQFADSTGKAITSCFAGPQDPDVWPNQGEVEVDDPRWTAYLDSLPEAMRSNFA